MSDKPPQRPANGACDEPTEEVARANRPAIPGSNPASPETRRDAPRAQRTLPRYCSNN